MARGEHDWGELAGAWLGKSMAKVSMTGESMARGEHGWGRAWLGGEHVWGRA